MELSDLQERYVAAFSAATEGLHALSFGAFDEGGFSHCACGLCGCPLGGQRYSYHYVVDGVVYHEDDGCEDCRMFHANGDAPDDEYLEWLR